MLFKLNGKKELIIKWNYILKLMKIYNYKKEFKNLSNF